MTANRVLAEALLDTAKWHLCRHLANEREHPRKWLNPPPVDSNN
jgi:hypothetical protein